MVARNLKVVKKNLLLVRYSFERIAESFKRGELQRRWGGKVTIGKTRSKSEVRGKRVRGMAGVVRAGQGACVVGCCEGDSKPAHARPAYAARKFSARACRPPPRRLGPGDAHGRILRICSAPRWSWLVFERGRIVVGGKELNVTSYCIQV